MTADVELPLPRYPVGGAGDEDSYNTGWNECLSECRSCVAHATAAKDAEIEALRAEVSGLQAARIGYASEFPPTEDGDPDVGNIHANIHAMKARAERLAEAAEKVLVAASARNVLAMFQAAEALGAALNPTAAQENDDA